MSMNKFCGMRNIICLFILLGLAGCKQTPSFRITGHIAGVENGWQVFLKNKNTGQILDTVVIQDGEFCFIGSTDESFYGEILIRSEKFDQFGSWFIENAELEIIGEWNQFEKACMSGSSLQDEYNAYLESLDFLTEKSKHLEKRYFEVYGQYLQNKTFKAEYIPAGIEIAKQQILILNQLQKAYVEYIKTHPDSFISLKALESLLAQRSCFTKAEKESWIASLSPKLKQTNMFKQMKQLIADYDDTAKGENFTDLRVIDVQGKEGWLSDYIQPGKYNLFEVWGVYCGHCRMEIPHLNIVHENYGDKLNIIALCWDEAKYEEDWKKALGEDKPCYLQLRQVDDVQKIYHLSHVPYSLIIDGDGKIVTERAKGAELDLLLEQHFGQEGY